MVRSLARIVLVVLILLVAAPSTQAAGSREEARSERSGSIFLMAWDFFADLWEELIPSTGNNGCWVDPSGSCGG